MRKFSLRTITAMLVLSFVIAGCTKKADTVTGPTDPGTKPLGTPVSTERRMAVLDSFTSLESSLTSLDQNSANQKLLDNLRAQPEIAKAGVTSTGSLYAVFTDGRLFIHSWSFENTTIFPNASSLLPKRSNSSLSKVTDNLPSTKTATVLNSLGSWFEPGVLNPFGYYGAEQTRLDISKMLTDAGYSVRPGNDASVAGLKNVNGDDAVFHWTAHGDTGYNIDSSEVYYGIWTTDKVGSVAEDGFKTELDAEELVYFSAPNSTTLGRPTSEIHYAITAKFVQHYMHFGANSLVFISACGSNSNDINGSGTIREAFGAKGASVYVGWSTYTACQGSFYDARFFFDRALGMNRVKPVPNPPQRPFEYYLVHEDMQFRGLDKTSTTVRSKKYDAILMFTPLQGDFIQLLPTISLGAVTDQTKLYLSGAFGKIAGVVKFNGTPLATDPWKSSTLSMAHPQTGGLIWVEVNGLASNKLPLTEWDGTITYTYTGNGSLKQTVTFNLVLIADVHRYRVVSGADVIWPDQDYWGTFRGAYISPKSSGSFVASGEYRDPTTHELLESWTGGGSLQASAFGSTGTGFSAFVMIDSVGGHANLISMVSEPYTRFTKQGGNQPATIVFNGGLGSFDVIVKPGFVLPPSADSIGTAKFAWSGATPDPRYVQQPTDQR
jgi:hypothetical protein